MQHKINFNKPNVLFTITVQKHLGPVNFQQLLLFDNAGPQFWHFLFLTLASSHA